MGKAPLVFSLSGKETGKGAFGAGRFEDSAILRDIVPRGETKLLLVAPGSSESQRILPAVTGDIPSPQFCPRGDW